MSKEHGQQPSGARKGRRSRDKKSRKRSRRKETYSIYIYKVLKQVRGGHWRVRGTCGREPGAGGGEGRWAESQDSV